MTAPSGAETELSDEQCFGAVVAPSGTQTELSGAQYGGAVASPSGSETEFEDVEFCGAVASPSGIETVMKNVKFCGAGAVFSGTETGLGAAQSRGLMVTSSGPLRCAGFLVKVMHVTFLVNGRDDVPCLLLALASKRAASALRRVRLVLQIRSSLVGLRIHLHELHGSALHSTICVSLTALPSLHIIHTRVCLLHVVW